MLNTFPKLLVSAMSCNGLSVDDGIEDVERLESQLQPQRFLDGKRTEEGCVEIPVPRRSQSVPSEIAKRVLRGNLKSGRINDLFG